MQKISHTTLNGNDFGFSFRCAKEQSEIVVVTPVAIFHICRFRNKSFLSQCQKRSGAGCAAEPSAERSPPLQPGRAPLAAPSAGAQRSALPPTFQLLLVRHVALDEQRPLRFELLVQGRLALLSGLGVAVQQGYLSGE